MSRVGDTDAMERALRWANAICEGGPGFNSISPERRRRKKDSISGDLWEEAEDGLWNGLKRK